MAYQKKRQLNRYTVYDRRTDLPVMVNGTARECAAAMGVTLGSFRTLYTKLKNGCPAVGHRWEIFKDGPDDLEE